MLLNALNQYPSVKQKLLLSVLSSLPTPLTPSPLPLVPNHVVNPNLNLDLQIDFRNILDNRFLAFLANQMERT